jgi:hypothetical protein
MPATWKDPPVSGGGVAVYSITLEERLLEHERALADAKMAYASEQRHRADLDARLGEVLAALERATGFDSLALIERKRRLLVDVAENERRLERLQRAMATARLQITRLSHELARIDIAPVAPMWRLWGMLDRRAERREQHACMGRSRQRESHGTRRGHRRTVRRTVSRSAGGGSDSESSGPGEAGLSRHPRHGLVNDRMARFLSACCIECGAELEHWLGKLRCSDPSCPRWGQPS